MPLFPTNDILIYPALLLATLLITYTVYLLGELAHETTHLLAIWITGSTLTDIKINLPTGLTDPLLGIQMFFEPITPNAQRLIAAAPWIMLGPQYTLLIINTYQSPSFLKILGVFALTIALLPNHVDYNALMNA